MGSKGWARASRHRALQVMGRGLDFIRRGVGSNYRLSKESNLLIYIFKRCIWIRKIDSKGTRVG